MPEIDSINNQSLYFAATQIASQKQARRSKKTEKYPASKKSSFAVSLKKSQEEAELISEGLPPEIAGMEEEEAFVFLKDAVDSAGDELKEYQNPEAIEKYRRKIGQFMKYMTKNNFKIITQKRGFSKKTGKQIAPYIQIAIINEKLNSLVSDLLYNHSKNLNILARVDEINGLVIDLMAS